MWFFLIIIKMKYITYIDMRIIYRVRLLYILKASLLLKLNGRIEEGWFTVQPAPGPSILYNTRWIKPCSFYFRTSILKKMVFISPVSSKLVLWSQRCRFQRRNPSRSLPLTAVFCVFITFLLIFLLQYSDQLDESELVGRDGRGKGSGCRCPAACFDVAEKSRLVQRCAIDVEDANRRLSHVLAQHPLGNDVVLFVAYYQRRLLALWWLVICIFRRFTKKLTKN